MEGEDYEEDEMGDFTCGRGGRVSLLKAFEVSFLFSFFPPIFLLTSTIPAGNKCAHFPSKAPLFLSSPLFLPSPPGRQHVRRRRAGVHAMPGVTSEALMEAQDIFGDVSELIEKRQLALEKRRREEEREKMERGRGRGGSAGDMEGAGSGLGIPGASWLRSMSRAC